MTSQLEKQIITKLMSPNISRSKGNQAMIFGQLIRYTMRNIFFEKSYTKCGGETIPRPFPKKNKIDHISRLIVLNLIICFYCMLS